MIIGAILESTQYSTGQQSNVLNGTAIIQFITMNDAISWAQLQSQQFIYGSESNDVTCLCTVINTDTGERRWWFNGSEYTG